MRKISLLALLSIVLLTACGDSKKNDTRSHEISSEEFQKDFNMVDSINSMTMEEIDAYAQKLIDQDKKCVVIFSGNEEYLPTFVVNLKSTYGLSTAMYSKDNTPAEIRERVERLQTNMDKALKEEYGEDFRERFLEEAKTAYQNGLGFEFATYNANAVKPVCESFLSNEVKAKATIAVVHISADGSISLKEIQDIKGNPIPVDAEAMAKINERLEATSPVKWNGKGIDWDDNVPIANREMMQF